MFPWNRVMQSRNLVLNRQTASQLIGKVWSSLFSRISRNTSSKNYGKYQELKKILKRWRILFRICFINLIKQVPVSFCWNSSLLELPSSNLTGFKFFTKAITIISIALRWVFLLNQISFGSYGVLSLLYRSWVFLRKLSKNFDPPPDVPPHSWGWLPPRPIPPLPPCF